MMATSGDLWEAFGNAIAVAEEFHGAGIEEKLAQFDLDAEALREVLHERWEAYRHEFDPAQPHLMFVQAMTEGLLAGLKMRGVRGG